MCAASCRETSLDDLEANPGLLDELYAEECRLPTTLLCRPAGSDDRRAWDPSSAKYRASTMNQISEPLPQFSNQNLRRSEACQPHANAH